MVRHAVGEGMEVWTRNQGLEVTLGAPLFVSISLAETQNQGLNNKILIKLSPPLLGARRPSNHGANVPKDLCAQMFRGQRQ